MRTDLIQQAMTSASAMSIYDLTYLYYKSRYELSPSEPEIAIIISNIAEALKRGWLNEDILAQMVQDIHNNTDDKHMLYHHRFNDKHGEVNLLSPEKEYYHSYLINTCNPTQVHWDDNLGVSETTEEQYYLENKSQITFNQITDYFLSRCKDVFGSRGSYPDRKYVYMGIAKAYAQIQDVDILLFAIDACINNSYSAPKNVMACLDYLYQAKDTKNIKLTRIRSIREDGESFVIPKHRV